MPKTNIIFYVNYNWKNIKYKENNFALMISAEKQTGAGRKEYMQCAIVQLPLVCLPYIPAKKKDQWWSVEATGLEKREGWLTRAWEGGCRTLFCLQWKIEMKVYNQSVISSDM